MSVLWNKIVTRTKVGSWLGIYADLDTPGNELKLGDAGAFTHCSKVDDVNQGIPYTRGEWGKYGDDQEPNNAGECRVDEYCVGINDDGKLFDIACDTDPDGHLNGGFTYNCLCEIGIHKERYEEDAGELSFLSPGGELYFALAIFLCLDIFNTHYNFRSFVRRVLLGRGRCSYNHRRYDTNFYLLLLLLLLCNQKGRGALWQEAEAPLAGNQQGSNGRDTLPT